MKRMLTRKPFNNMKGLTVLETLLALALGLGVTVGAVVFYVQGRTSSNVSKAVSDMNSIVAGYNAYIAAGNSVTSATLLSDIQTAGFLPTTLTNPWGSAYSVAASSTGTIAITLTGIGGMTSSPVDPNCKTIKAAVANSGGSVNSAATCIVTFNL